MGKDLKGWRVDQRCHQGIDRRLEERQRSGRRAGAADRNHICPGGFHRYGWSRQIEVLQEKLLYLKPDWAQRSEVLPAPPNSPTKTRARLAKSLSR